MVVKTSFSQCHSGGVAFGCFIVLLLLLYAATFPSHVSLRALWGFTRSMPKADFGM